MPDSTTFWVQQLKAGNRDAAQQLWERYYSRLVEAARKRLQRGPRTTTSDEDDFALSAFASFYRAAEMGKFPLLDDSSDFWRLLLCFAQRKIVDHLRQQRCQKRSLRTDEQQPRKPVDLDDIVGEEPTPEFCAAAVESFRELLSRLPDEGLRVLALMKMEGHTNQEIAKRLQCSLTTVERKLRRIRHEWKDAFLSHEERANE